MTNSDTPWQRWLRHELAQRGWRPVDLSRASSVQRSVVGRWISEGTVPDVRTARKAARALDVSLQELLVQAGVLTEDEAAPQTRPADPTALTDTALLGELARRLAERHTQGHVGHLGEAETRRRPSPEQPSDRKVLEDSTTVRAAFRPPQRRTRDVQEEQWEWGDA